MRKIEKQLLNGIAAGDIQIVRMAISKNVDVNCSNAQGITPLMLSARLNLPDIMKLLLANNADSSRRDYISRTAMSFALKYNAIDALMVLLNHEEDIGHAG